MCMCALFCLCAQRITSTCFIKHGLALPTCKCKCPWPTHGHRRAGARCAHTTPCTQLAVIDMTALPVSGRVYLAALPTYSKAIIATFGATRCPVEGATVCAYNSLDGNQVRHGATLLGPFPQGQPESRCREEAACLQGWGQLAYPASVRSLPSQRPCACTYLVVPWRCAVSPAVACRLHACRLTPMAPTCLESPSASPSRLMSPWAQVRGWRGYAPPRLVPNRSYSELWVAASWLC